MKISYFCNGFVIELLIISPLLNFQKEVVMARFYNPSTIFIKTRCNRHIAIVYTKYKIETKYLGTSNIVKHST